MTLFWTVPFKCDCFVNILAAHDVKMREQDAKEPEREDAARNWRKLLAYGATESCSKYQKKIVHLPRL